jgi:choline dehydrogenase-like flavoprotein
MSHPGAPCWGLFDEPMTPWEGFVLNHLCCLDYAQTHPGVPYIRGFAIETLTPLPVGAATGPAAGLWGAALTALMRQYDHLGGLFTICEGMPTPANRVTVEPALPDGWGLPRAHLHYDWHPNDVRLMDAAAAQSLAVLRAAGAREVWRQAPAQVHMMGTARMGADPRDSVTTADGQTHDVPNLYLAGGALFPTGSSVNPTLTILALAWRTAEHVARGFGRGLQSATEPGTTRRSADH